MKPGELWRLKRWHVAYQQVPDEFLSLVVLMIGSDGPHAPNAPPVLQPGNLVMALAELPEDNSRLTAYVAPNYVGGRCPWRVHYVLTAYGPRHMVVDDERCLELVAS